MDLKDYIATIAAEECAEVAQRISKALRFGWTEIQPGQPLTNAERVVEEYGDLTAMMEMMVDQGLITPDYTPSFETVHAKKAKVAKFMAISREQGILS